MTPTARTSHVAASAAVDIPDAINRVARRAVQRVARQRTRATARDRVPQAPTRSPWKPRGRRRGFRVVDFLCGAGGSGAGLSNAGWDLVFAANHWQVAIDTHQMNFPDVWHECVDVTTINLRKLPRAHALWISPICTESSPAGGNGAGWKERKEEERGQQSLWDEEPVEQAGMEKTRATFWEAIRYVEVWHPEIVFLENVPDVVRKWRLFKRFLQCMEDEGYRWQLINVNSAHIGNLAEGIPYAPQWRDRMYIVFVRKDIKRDYDFTPRPLSQCFGCREIVEGVQTWTKDAQARWIRYGRYRRDPSSSYGSYWYTCPRGCRDERGRPARVEPFVLPAVAAIDWHDLGSPIAESWLVANTLRRMAAGQDIFWPDPQLTTVRGNTFTRGDYLRTWSAARGLVPTLTTDATVGLNLPPFVYSVNHDDGENRAYLPHQRPMNGLTQKMGAGLVLPSFSTIVGGRRTGDPESGDSRTFDRPMRTQLTTESEMLTFPAGQEPFLSVLRNNMDGESIHGPVPTLTTARHVGLVLPYHTERPAAPPVDPLETVLTRDRFSVINGDSGDDEWVDVLSKDGEVVRMRNCLHRMLNSDEAARAQCLPVDDGYIITGTGEQRMAQVGNAVSSNAAMFFGLGGAEILEAA